MKLNLKEACFLSLCVKVNKEQGRADIVTSILFPL